jgi:glutamate formiminotransferase/glutamate formiminotransferase/formiminotetrahydrofolate cyclodeaminase
MAVLESVPNVSEGRDLSAVAAVADAFASSGARVLDTHVDSDHNRAVVTLVGDEGALVAGLVAGIDEARRRIDLRRHAGVHPRVGAADVVPVVPLERRDAARAAAVARAVAQRVGDELGLPVFLYGALAGGRRPAFYRRGGPEALQARVDAGEVAPAYGPPRLDPGAGAVLVGVRAPLLAFNLDLDGSLEEAAEVAAAVRESSGGLPGVQALALELAHGIQLSTNVIDLDATPPHVLVDRIVAEARARGLGVGAGELVGLIPAASVAQAAAAAGVEEPLDLGGVLTPAALEAAAHALRLERLEPDCVLDWHLLR